MRVQIEEAHESGGQVNGRYGHPEVSSDLIGFENLQEFPSMEPSCVDEAEKGEETASPEVCAGVSTLKPKLLPLLSLELAITLVSIEHEAVEENL